MKPCCVEVAKLASVDVCEVLHPPESDMLTKHMSLPNFTSPHFSLPRFALLYFASHYFAPVCASC